MTMEYRGFEAEVTYDRASGMLTAVVRNTPRTMTLTRATVAALREEFHRAIDAYVTFCEERGADP